MPSLTLKKLHSIAKEIILPVNYYTAGGGSGDDMKKQDEKKTETKVDKSGAINVASEQQVQMSLAKRVWLTWHGTDFLKRKMETNDFEKLRLDGKEYVSHVELFCAGNGDFQGLVDKDMMIVDMAQIGVAQHSDDDKLPKRTDTI